MGSDLRRRTLRPAQAAYRLRSRLRRTGVALSHRLSIERSSVFRLERIAPTKVGQWLRSTSPHSPPKWPDTTTGGRALLTQTSGPCRPACNPFSRNRISVIRTAARAGWRASEAVPLPLCSCGCRCVTGPVRSPNWREQPAWNLGGIREVQSSGCGHAGGSRHAGWPDRHRRLSLTPCPMR